MTSWFCHYRYLLVKLLTSMTVAGFSMPLKDIPTSLKLHHSGNTDDGSIDGVICKWSLCIDNSGFFAQYTNANSVTYNHLLMGGYLLFVDKCVHAWMRVLCTHVYVVQGGVYVCVCACYMCVHYVYYVCVCVCVLRVCADYPCLRPRWDFNLYFWSPAPGKFACGDS